MNSHTEYAVVDLETTGLSANWNDRIVEVAILRLDQRGQTIDQYVSLVNPKRDIGPTHIHGITTADVSRAPELVEIAGDLVSILQGSVFVAHNANFDRQFLHIELAKCGFPLPDFPTMCTMRLAKEADRHIPGRKLEVLCEHFGIRLTDAHEALADCTATASLFRVCVDALGGWDSERLAQNRLRSFNTSTMSWPTLSPSGKSYCRKSATNDLKKRRSRISELVARLPSSSSFDDAPDEYFTLLDRVLEDRLVEAQEIQNLEQLAQDNGMSKEQAETAHREYLRNLMMVARSDGVLSSVELVDLKEVSRLLGIPVKDFDDLMSETDETEAEVGDLCNKDSAAADDIRGKSVCFTGAMLSKVNGNPVTRDFAQQAASDCGMVIQKGVTKTLDYLVVADPESMSGKAKKARKYEVRIIAEAVFWQMVGVDLV